MLFQNDNVANVSAPATKETIPNNKRNSPSEERTVKLITMQEMPRKANQDEMSAGQMPSTPMREKPEAPMARKVVITKSVDNSH